jgi:hypothetical protein
MIRTVPSGKSVAVCPLRGTCMEPDVGCDVPESGSQIQVPPLLRSSPTISQRPSANRVDVALEDAAGACAALSN